MDRAEWDLTPDSVQLAMDHFLPRSGSQVVRESFYGVRRFDDFAKHTGLTPTVLAQRLRDLVRQGILCKVPYREGSARQRHEYRLTDKGLELAPALIALGQWADRWLPGPDGPTVELQHRGCGKLVTSELRCAAGHRVQGVEEVVATPGPGAKHLAAQ